MRYNATIRQIEVIGEAIRNLEKSFTSQYPDIPWKEIIAMRNILIHEYWQTDIPEIYATAVEDVPELQRLVNSILQDLKTQEAESNS